LTSEALVRMALFESLSAMMGWVQAGIITMIIYEFIRLLGDSGVKVTNPLAGRIGDRDTPARNGSRVGSSPDKGEAERAAEMAEEASKREVQLTAVSERFNAIQRNITTRIDQENVTERQQLSILTEELTGLAQLRNEVESLRSAHLEGETAARRDTAVSGYERVLGSAVGRVKTLMEKVHKKREDVAELTKRHIGEMKAMRMDDYMKKISTGYERAYRKYKSPNVVNINPEESRLINEIEKEERLVDELFKDINNEEARETKILKIIRDEVEKELQDLKEILNIFTSAAGRILTHDELSQAARLLANVDRTLSQEINEERVGQQVNELENRLEERSRMFVANLARLEAQQRS
jgi:hypothetical protein